MNSDKTKGQNDNPKSYQEDADAMLETQRAVNTVPIKNYSDYEITIESKEHYEDALFSNENELTQALTEAADKKHQPKNTSPQVTTKLLDESRRKKIYDFSAFVNKQSNITTADNGPTNKLTIINNGINDSPARKQIPFGQQADVFSQQLAQEGKLIEQEQRQDNAASVNHVPHKKDEAQTVGGAFSSFTQKLKAKGHELSLRGKARLDKSKADLDEYFGRSLPERELDLEFILSTVKNKKDLSINFNEQDIIKLFTSKGKNLSTLLDRADKDLSALSKIQLSNSKRLGLLNTYAKPLSVKFKSLITMFERKPVAFDDEKRITAIGLALSASKYLTMGYKQIYADIYQSANVIYGPQRKMANEVAFHLLDCLLLEQQLCVALHTPPPTATIKTANKLFAALSLYEPEQLLFSQPSISLEKNSNIEELYCRFQLAANLNLRPLSTGLHRSLQAYFQQHASLLKVLPLTVTQRLTLFEAGQQLWQINYQRDTPPNVIHYDKKLAHTDIVGCIFIQVQALFNQIKKDYVEALKLRMAQRQQHSSPALQALSIEQCLLLLSTLNRAVRDNENHRQADFFSLYQSASIKAYSGLSNCIAYCKYDYALKSKGLTTGQSGYNLPDRPLSSKAQWQLAHEDTAALFLQTSEHKLSFSLEVDSLLLLVITTDNDDVPNGNKESDTIEEKVVLSCIRSIERNPQGKLLITARKISEHITHVNILQADTDIETVLICRNADHKLLITQSDLPVHSLQELRLCFPDGFNGNIQIKGLSEQYQQAQGLNLC